MYIYHSNGKNGYLQISRCKTYDEAVELYTKNYWDKFYKQLHSTYPNRRIESEAEFLETIDTLFYPAPWLPKNAWDAKPESFARRIREIHRYVRAEPKLEAIMDENLPF